MRVVEGNSIQRIQDRITANWLGLVVPTCGDATVSCHSALPHCCAMGPKMSSTSWDWIWGEAADEAAMRPRGRGRARGAGKRRKRASE